MSQITRCPSCATLFKVVPDQLRISDGWVRCGHCKKVFDATLSLQKAPAPVPPSGKAASRTGPEASPETALPAASVADADNEKLLASLDSPAAVLADEHQDADAERTSAAQAQDDRATNAASPSLQQSEPPSAESQGNTAVTAQVTQEADEPRFSPVLTSAASVQGPTGLEPGARAAERLDGDGVRLGAGQEGSTAPLLFDDLPVPVPVPGIAGAGSGPAEESLGSVPTAAPEPSFVRSARRKALWHTPAVRLVLGGCVLLLAAALLAQVAVQQRHYLASVQPQWRPALEALCVPLQCDVQPYRHIASVAVDSSSFNKLHGTTYRFALALKNQSAVAVALPAVELTLTDTSEQPLLRRVFTPAELAAPATLPPGGEWAGSLEMDLRLAGNADARIAGYRVLAFYP